MIEESILNFIPPRYPFVMVDNLLYADEEKAASNFTIQADNIFVENGEFVAAGILENIAQTVAAGAGYKERMEGKAVSGGYIASVRNFEVFFLPKINDVLTTEVTVTGKVFAVTAVNGKIFLNNILIAQCEMKIFSNSGE